MALTGVSKIEKEDIVLPSDPSHIDNIKLEALSKGIKGDPLKDEDFMARYMEAHGEATYFVIGNLTMADREELGDMNNSMRLVNGSMQMDQKGYARACEAVRRGLIGWKNFEPHAFTTTTKNIANRPREIVSDASMECLTRDMIMELGQIILEKNGLRTELEKKFDGVSPLSEGSLTGDALLAPLTNSEGGDASKEAPNPQTAD